MKKFISELKKKSYDFSKIDIWFLLNKHSNKFIGWNAEHKCGNYCPCHGDIKSGKSIITEMGIYESTCVDGNGKLKSVKYFLNIKGSKGLNVTTQIGMGEGFCSSHFYLKSEKEAELWLPYGANVLIKLTKGEKKK